LQQAENLAVKAVEIGSLARMGQARKSLSWRGEREAEKRKTFYPNRRIFVK
jgi:hypothetical protein